MRQAHSRRTKVSQLWYMMLQTCKQSPFSVCRHTVREAGWLPGPYHHGYQSADVALLHDHLPKQEKGTLPGLAGGGSCQAQRHHGETVPGIKTVSPKLLCVRS